VSSPAFSPIPRKGPCSHRGPLLLQRTQRDGLIMFCLYYLYLTWFSYVSTICAKFFQNRGHKMYEIYEMIDGFWGLPGWGWILVFYLSGAVVAYGLDKGSTMMHRYPMPHYHWCWSCECTFWFLSIFSWLGAAMVFLQYAGRPSFRFHVPKKERNA